MCAPIQFEDAGSGGSINLPEGLSFIINDIAFPNHVAPEALPCLRLCCSLICVPGVHGFFYTNDVKVRA